MNRGISFNPPVADILSDHAFFDGIYIKTDRFVDPFWDRVLPIMAEEQIFMCRQMKKTIKDLREKKNAGLHVLDIGTGSGVLAIYADHLLNRDNNYLQSQIVALDKSERAMKFAKMNCRLNGCKNVKFLPAQEYSLNSVEPKSQDVILVNPPFNLTHDSLKNRIALHARGGRIGIDVLTDWLYHIPDHLNPDGVVIGYHMSPLDCNGEIVALAKIHEVLGDSSIVHYCRVLEKYYETENFLLGQYADYLSMLKKHEIDNVEIWIKQQAEKYPYLTIVYYEAWKTAGTGEIQNDLSPIWSHERSWEDRMKIHRIIVNTAQNYPEELTTQQIITSVNVPYFQSGSYAFHDEYWDREKTYSQDMDMKNAREKILKTSILNNVTKYLENSDLLKMFDFILVDPTPIISGSQNYRRINEECAIWPGQAVAKLSKSDQTRILEGIINEYQKTTVLLQRSRLAPFFHPVFVYPHPCSGWPRGWLSNMKGMKRTISCEDGYFMEIWNYFQEFERKFAKPGDKKPFSVFETEFKEGEKAFVYSMARLTELIDEGDESFSAMSWRPFLESYEKRKQAFVKTSNEPEDSFPERDFSSIQYTMLKRLQQKGADILKEANQLSEVDNLFSVLIALPLHTGQIEDVSNLLSLDSNNTLPKEYFGGLWIWALRLNGEPPLSYNPMFFDLARFTERLLKLYAKELFKDYQEIGKLEGEKNKAIVAGHEAGAQLQFIQSILGYVDHNDFLPDVIRRLVDGSINYISLYLISDSQFIDNWLPWPNTKVKYVFDWIKICIAEAWNITIAKTVRNLSISDVLSNQSLFDELLTYTLECKVIPVEQNKVAFSPPNYESYDRAKSLPTEILKWYLSAISNAIEYRAPMRQRTIISTLNFWNKHKNQFKDIVVKVKNTQNDTLIGVYNKCDKKPCSPNMKKIGGTEQTLILIEDWLKASNHCFKPLNQKDCNEFGWEYGFEASMHLPIKILSE